MNNVKIEQNYDNQRTKTLGACNHKVWNKNLNRNMKFYKCWNRSSYYWSTCQSSRFWARAFELTKMKEEMSKSTFEHVINNKW